MWLFLHLWARWTGKPILLCSLSLFSVGSTGTIGPADSAGPTCFADFFAGSAGSAGIAGSAVQALLALLALALGRAVNCLEGLFPESLEAQLGPRQGGELPGGVAS